MSRHWIKLYCKLLTDATIQRWPVGQRYCWIGTLLIAAESSQPGVLVDDAGHPLTDSDLAQILNVSRWTAKHFRERALAAGKLTQRHDGSLVVRNFTRLQGAPLTSGSRRKSVGNPSATDAPSKETRTRDSRSRDRDVELSAVARGPAGLTFSQPTGLSLEDAHAVTARLFHADAKTPAVLMSVASGLPNGAIASALEALDLRRSRTPRLESDAKYLVHILKEKRGESFAA